MIVSLGAPPHRLNTLAIVTFRCAPKGTGKRSKHVAPSADTSMTVAIMPAHDRTLCMALR